MFLKNFFKERIEIDENKPIKEEVERIYNLPIANQHILRLKSCTFISVVPSIQNLESKQNSNTLISEELKALGVTEDELNLVQYESGKVSDLKKYLLPYVFNPKDETLTFRSFDKSILENIDSSVNNINERKKKFILKNLDDYIASFFNNS